MSERAFFYEWKGNERPKADSLEELRDHLLYHEKTDHTLFLNTGHFLTWYAAVEMSITMLLYWAVNNHPAKAKFDPEMFNLLTVGMDAKVKTTRLKQAILKRKVKIPDALKKRLSHFTQVHAEIRNNIVHGFMGWEEDRLGIYRAHDFTPWGKVVGDDFKPVPSYSISGPDLFERALWLRLFARDVGEIAHQVAGSGKLHIDRYRSPEPKAALESQRSQSAPTKARKLAQSTKRAPPSQSAKAAGSQRRPRKDATGS